MSSNAPVEVSTVEVSTVDRTTATSFLMKSSTFEAGRATLYNLGIKTSYNDSVMIFSTMHTQRIATENSYTQECNGLVLERETWRPLVVPPRSLRSNIDTEISNIYVHQGLYHIYHAEDGTCFNMYFYNGKWIISTAKGHTMNNVIWGDKSYQEIISDCLEIIGLSWESFTSLLDVKHCYSFGFKHPDFHKFFAGSNPLFKLWFIQSVDTNENSNRYLWASDQSPIAIISSQEFLKTPISGLRELYKKAAYSLKNYLMDGSISYGFILRSTNTKITKNHSDLFIESSLMRTIRRFWYENNTIDACHKNNWNKVKAVTLQAFLDKEMYTTFKLMYPQYDSMAETYDKILSDVVSEMTSLVSKNKLNKNITESPGDSDVQNNIKKQASFLLTCFTKTTKYDLRGENAPRVNKALMEFVHHPASLEFLMELV